jgi:hypothetical protein
MSKQVSLSDFYLLRKRLTEGYVPLSPRALETWAADWSSGLERLHYVRSGKFTIAQGLKELVRLRGAVHVRKSLLPMAQPDLTHIWSEYVAKDMNAYHAIDIRHEGFDFHFAAIDAQSQYITGWFTVLRMEEP